MTDRAEIERLLNQTGRTLEGLPERYDDIAVKERIKELTGSYRWAGTSALLASHSLHQSDVIELLVGALRDALDKPMQKPLTAEEMQHRVFDGHPVYVEENRNDRAFDGYALAEDVEDAANFMMDEYGTGFRCWATRPTDEEREAAAWET